MNSSMAVLESDEARPGAAGAPFAQTQPKSSLRVPATHSTPQGSPQVQANELLRA